jgi:hypothetical protein
MHGLRIVGLALIAAIGYGVVHEGITALVSPEHITLGHVDLWAGYLKSTRGPGLQPALSDRAFLALMALKWALIHTGFFGLVLGLCVAIAARAGGRPKLAASELHQPIGIMLVSMAASAALAGVVAGLLAANDQLSLPRVPMLTLPDDRHVPYLSAHWMHVASYTIGGLGAAVLVAWAWRKRNSVVAAV